MHNESIRKRKWNAWTLYHFESEYCLADFARLLRHGLTLRQRCWSIAQRHMETAHGRLLASHTVHLIVVEVSCVPVLDSVYSWGAGHCTPQAERASSCLEAAVHRCRHLNL